MESSPTTPFERCSIGEHAKSRVSRREKRHEGVPGLILLILAVYSCYTHKVRFKHLFHDDVLLCEKSIIQSCFSSFS